MINFKADLPSFGLSENDLSWLDERTLVVKKWNWEYSLAHAFQRHCLNELSENPRLRVLICCNHPKVFTNGRGLQRSRKDEDLKLVDFNPEEHGPLPWPLHQIERGGGLTFHHPGQFVFYPILRLNPAVLSLSKMMNEIFDFTAASLESWGLGGLSYQQKLLGLWFGSKKLASMGIAIERLTTFHGMALNLRTDTEMMSALSKMNPCGLSSSTYVAVEELIPLPKNALERFTEDFLQRIKHGWQ